MDMWFDAIYTVVEDEYETTKDACQIAENDGDVVDKLEGKIETLEWVLGLLSMDEDELYEKYEEILGKGDGNEI
jgi:hypothetical protein